MTQSGGGRIGGSGQLVSMTSDTDALINSPDPRVQKIVKNAPIVATFEIPRDAILGAPSDLSEVEGEVLVVNDFEALSAM